MINIAALQFSDWYNKLKNFADLQFTGLKRGFARSLLQLTKFTTKYTSCTVHTYQSRRGALGILSFERAESSRAGLSRA
jgi:hypothetical protein